MSNDQGNNLASEKKSIDLTIKLILILVLVAWCVMIIFPFITPMLWGIILTITLLPMYHGLLKMVKGKKGLASSIITLLLLALLLVPAVMMISSIFDEVRELKTALTNKTLVVPPPNPKVAEWPLVGKKLYTAWSSLSTNVEATLLTYKVEILGAIKGFAGALKGLVSNILMFTLSIIIMGFLMAYSKSSEASTAVLTKRLFGDRSDEYTKVIVQTIRNVAKGILGVAFFQFILMGICFMLAGVPLAGLWALVVFLFALVQLPGGLVAIPVVVYIYSVKEPGPATFWAVIILICGLSDNVIKPLLMGKGAPVPMLVIFLGAIGGFVLSGFIGLFTGAIVLSLGYKLTGLWVHDYKSQSVSDSV